MIGAVQFISPSLVRVLRVFRIARLIRVLEFVKGIRQFVVALIVSLPALLNVGTLLFIVMFIYAIIGMYLFGPVKQQGSLNDIVNFETFANSLLLLFRLSTAAGWNDVLESLTVSPPHCDNDVPPGNCGRMWTAVIYLVSYIFVIFLIIVNMYIAIILENVNTVQEEDEFIISKEVFNHYYRLWALHVPGGKQFLPYQKLSSFVAGLWEPLQIPQPNKLELVNMNIPINKANRVHIFDLLKALVKRVLEREGEESPEVFDEVVQRMELRFRRKFALRMRVESWETTQDKYNATTRVLQAAHVTNKAKNRFLSLIKAQNTQSEGKECAPNAPTIDTDRRRANEGERPGSILYSPSASGNNINLKLCNETLNETNGNNCINNKTCSSNVGKSRGISSIVSGNVGSLPDPLAEAEVYGNEIPEVCRKLRTNSNLFTADSLARNNLNTMHERSTFVTQDVRHASDHEEQYNAVITTCPAKYSRGISISSPTRPKPNNKQINVDEVFERAFARRKQLASDSRHAAHENSSTSDKNGRVNLPRTKTAGKKRHQL